MARKRSKDRELIERKCGVKSLKVYGYTLNKHTTFSLLVFELLKTKSFPEKNCNARVLKGLTESAYLRFPMTMVFCSHKLSDHP